MTIMGLLSSSATAIFSSFFILPFQNERPFSFSLPQTHFSTPLMAEPVASPSPHTSSSSRQHKKPSLLLTKRIFSLSSILLNLTMPTTMTTISSAMAEEQQQQLERYTDINEDFTLLKPSSWIKVDKAGATVLFEEANKGANNVGIVVTPVRLNTLGDFGTPQFVAEKLIQAEKRKESTKDAEVIGVAERSGHGGLQVYEFEYKVDSTRGGMKRIFSAAFVSSKKLYLLNIAYSDRPENPLDSHTRMMLEQVLHSFDTASST